MRRDAPLRSPSLPSAPVLSSSSPPALTHRTRLFNSTHAKNKKTDNEGTGEQKPAKMSSGGSGDRRAGATAASSSSKATTLPKKRPTSAAAVVDPAVARRSAAFRVVERCV